MLAGPAGTSLHSLTAIVGDFFWGRGREEREENMLSKSWTTCTGQHAQDGLQGGTASRESEKERETEGGRERD